MSSGFSAQLTVRPIVYLPTHFLLTSHCSYSSKSGCKTIMMSYFGHNLVERSNITFWSDEGFTLFCGLRPTLSRCDPASCNCQAGRQAARQAVRQAASWSKKATKKAVHVRFWADKVDLVHTFWSLLKVWPWFFEIFPCATFYYLQACKSAERYCIGPHFIFLIFIFFIYPCFFQQVAAVTSLSLSLYCLEEDLTVVGSDFNVLKDCKMRVRRGSTQASNNG